MFIFVKYSSIIKRNFKCLKKNHKGLTYDTPETGEKKNSVKKFNNISVFVRLLIAEISGLKSEILEK